MAHIIEGRWIVSPQDIVAALECTHKLALQGAVRAGTFPATLEEDPGLDLLRRIGLRHESDRLAGLSPDLRIKRLAVPPHTLAAYQGAWEATSTAMDDGYDVIYQATLFTGDFIGIADFLVLARDSAGKPARSGDGRLIYEPVDTKSARSAKRGAILQLGAYAEALARLGRPAPAMVHLWLAADRDWTGPADTFIALSRRYREQVIDLLPSVGALPTPDWGAPCEACKRCTFANFCQVGRRRDRDISMVQEIRSNTRQKFVDAGVQTIDELAALSDDERPDRVSRETFGRLRAQADIQVRGAGKEPPLFELIDKEVLQLLPAPSSMDMWFDMEGDPFAPWPNGLEYMFGYSYLVDGALRFATTEASDPTSERGAFEDFVDEVMRRMRRDPGMHVYHYANYEQRTLRRLAQQHGTREDEVDLLLREGRLVDLYRIVRGAFRFSTESLSLKAIEAVYGVTHAGEDVSTAKDSVIQFERSVALRQEGKIEQADAILKSIRDYNELDCESTWKLDRWLRRFTEAAPHVGPVSVAPTDEEESSALGIDPH